MKTKPWFDSSRLVGVTNSEGDTVRVLFPFVVEIEKLVKESLNPANAVKVNFVRRSGGLKIHKEQPKKIEETRDVF